MSVLLLMLLSPALHASNDPITVKPVDPNKKICRFEPKPGSRLGGAKICRTAAEWREVEAQSQKGLRDLTRQNHDRPHEGVR